MSPTIAMTEQQIRDTVAQMEQETPAQYRRPKAKLLKLALAGEQGARFVVHTHWVRHQDTGRCPA